MIFPPIFKKWRKIKSDVLFTVRKVRSEVSSFMSFHIIEPSIDFKRLLAKNINHVVLRFIIEVIKPNVVEQVSRCSEATLKVVTKRRNMQ